MCSCCGSILSLVQILFPLNQTHYHQITTTKTKEIKFEPRIKLNHNIATLWHDRIYCVAYTKCAYYIMARSDLLCGLQKIMRTTLWHDRIYCVAYTKYAYYIMARSDLLCGLHKVCVATLWHDRIYCVAYTKYAYYIMARSDLLCGLHKVCVLHYGTIGFIVWLTQSMCSHSMARSDLFICTRESYACHVVSHR